MQANVIKLLVQFLLTKIDRNVKKLCEVVCGYTLGVLIIVVGVYRN